MTISASLTGNNLGASSLIFSGGIFIALGMWASRCFAVRIQRRCVASLFRFAETLIGTHVYRESGIANPAGRWLSGSIDAHDRHHRVNGRPGTFRCLA